MELGLFLSSPDSHSLIWGRHEPWLVVVSVLLAVGAGVLALHTVQQARVARGRDRQSLLVGGGLALAGGEWAVHFVGMLGFDLGLPVHYRVDLALLSVVPGVLIATLALMLLAGPRVRLGRVLLAGLLVSLGVDATHHIAMSAMQMTPTLHFELLHWLGSLVVAAPLAMLAFWLRFGSGASRLGWNDAQGNLWAGAVMGLALSLTHYAGMLAARFVGEPDLLVGGGGAPLEQAARTTLFVIVLVGAVRALNARVAGRHLTHALTAAQLRYLALLDNLPSQLLQLDAHAPWVVRMANQRVVEFSGHGAADLIDRPFLDTALAPVDAVGQQHLTTVLTALQYGSSAETCEFEMRRADGAVRTMQLSAQPSRLREDADLYEIDVLLTDITDRHAQERELQLSRALILGSSEAIIGKSIDGTIQSWNLGATNLFGYTAAEAIGRHVAMLYRPGDTLQEAELMARVRAGQTVPRFEAVRLHKDGHPVEVTVTLSPIFDEAGQVVGASKIAHDIGDRKANEALRRAKEQAEQMAATRAGFLATMSHELRTPMNAVMGFTSVLLDTPLNPEQRKHVLTVQSAARSLLRLLNDILDTARLERGTLELENSRYDLPELLAELARVHGTAAAAKGLVFDWVARPDLPRLVHGDPMRVRQLLGNLLDNAVKFTAHGHVGLRAELIGGQLCVEISDTGLGMDAAQLARLFEPFTQGDGSMSRRFGGTGLGTAICHQLVQLMKGHIEVRSQPGQGSVFTVRLPMRLAEASAETGATAGPTLPALRVLVAGDAPEVAALLGEPHQTVRVADAAQALARVQTEAFDVILLHMGVPDLGGPETTRRLREAECEADRVPVPVIGLADAPQAPAEADAARAAGMEAVLVRPLNGVQMKQELARVLGLETAVEPQPVSSFDGVLLVDERLGVEIWGGMREVWVEGLVMFVQQLPAQREDIRNALAASDPLPATAAVHAMRGTASTLGLQALSHLLGNVETSLRRGDAALALRCAADLDPVIDRTLVALSPLLDELHQADDAAAGEPLLADEALALIDAMVDALRRGEAPSRQLERLRHVLGPGLKQPAWTQASQALDNFEFDRAALALADLRQWVVTQAGH